MDLRPALIALGLTGALVAIPQFEGVKLQSYVDPVGISTDCVGHTGPDVRRSNTMQQCMDKFYADVQGANAVVDSCVKVPLSSGERSAYVSFAFNVGRGSRGIKDGFCVLKSGKSPTFLTNLNTGHRTEACNGLLQWDKAGGQVLKGLTTRRSTEVSMCLQGVRND